jgi:outer membrane immunogenic protein
MKASGSRGIAALGVFLLGLTAIDFAAAADVPLAPPDALLAPVPVAHNWSGFHAGIFAGWAWGNVEASELFTTAFGGNFYGPNSSPYDFSTDGVMAGALAGYDWQWNQLVIGLGADAAFMDLRGSVTDPNFPPVPLGNELPVTSFESDFNGSLTLRTGVAFGRALIYARGGVAVLAAEASTIDPCGRSFCGQTTIESHGDDVLLGWTAGAGIEAALTNHWRAGAEYRFYDFEELEVSGVASNFLTYSQNLDLGDVHTVRGFLSYAW